MLTTKSRGAGASLDVMPYGVLSGREDTDEFIRIRRQSDNL